MNKFLAFICLFTNLMAADTPFAGATITSIIKPFTADDEPIETLLILRDGFTTDHPLLVRPDPNMEMTLIDGRPIRPDMLFDDHPDSIRRIITLRSLTDVNELLKLQKFQEVTLTSAIARIVTITTKCHTRSKPGALVKASQDTAVLYQGTWYQAPFTLSSNTDEEIQTRYKRDVSPLFKGKFINQIDVSGISQFIATVENGALTIELR